MGNIRKERNKIYVYGFRPYDSHQYRANQTEDDFIRRTNFFYERVGKRSEYVDTWCCPFISMNPVPVKRHDEWRKSDQIVPIRLIISVKFGYPRDYPDEDETE